MVEQAPTIREVPSEGFYPKDAAPMVEQAPTQAEAQAAAQTETQAAAQTETQASPQEGIPQEEAAPQETPPVAEEEEFTQGLRLN